jgi:uncharacterized protein (DUF2236 family)
VPTRQAQSTRTQAGLGNGPLFGSETMSWRILREPVVLAGGGRALLLQVAHPLVGAGVEQHSNYDSDPWGRLVGTLETTYAISFGDAEESARAAERLRRRHDRVKGTSPDGVDYDAQDPELLQWVWATLVETGVLLYERGFGPLSDSDRERFYQEQKLFGYACGMPVGGCPETYADFRAYYDRMIDEELRVTPLASAVARSIISTPVPLVLRPFFRANALFTAGLLPSRLRTEYGFEWGRSHELRLRAAMATLRTGRRVTPRALRELPSRWLGSGALRRGVGARVINRLRVAAAR